MASPFETKLPGEIRLAIYGDAFHFTGPLKKGPANSAATSTITSLLAVNKNIYNEAVDTLYEGNIFNFHLSSVCAERIATASRKRMFMHPYRELQIVTDASMLPCDVTCLLKLISDLGRAATSATSAPRVRVVTVLLQHGGFDLQRLLPGLESAGYAVNFTAVGRLDTMPKDKRLPRLRFQYPAMAVKWPSLAAIEPLNLGSLGKQSDRRLVEAACRFLNNFYAQEKERLAGEGLDERALLVWADSPHAHAADEHRRITDVLARTL
ncbi:hypothetical protein LTR85_007499 [Meristemomyces frigidus]|nr:hypothetical protein LTR85_007499 [Meristemomyces frigidus]